MKDNVSFFYFVFTSIFFFINVNISICSDSLHIKSNKSLTVFNGSLSSSYIIQKNYYTENLNNFLFLLNLDYFNRKYNDSQNQLWRFKSDLGFIKYIDSIWIKSNDKWRLDWIYDDISSRKFSHSYNIMVKSQWLDSWKYFNTQTEKLSKEWHGGFLNPLEMTFSYNVRFSFWDFNSILLGLTSIQLENLPRFHNAIEPSGGSLARTNNSWVTLNFGLSSKILIFQKQISENVLWDNSSNLFINGVNKEAINFDIENRLSFIFFKRMQFRFETNVRYDPRLSYKLQYELGFLIGFFYDKRIKK